MYSAILLGLLLWAAPGHAAATAPVAGMVGEVRASEMRAPFRWTATDCSYSYLKSSGRAFASSDPRSWFYGAGVGLAAAPATLLSVPWDLLAAHSRSVTRVDFELRGKLVDEAGTVQANETVQAAVQGWTSCGKDEACCEPVFSTGIFLGKTDSDGRVDLHLWGTFDPNRDVFVALFLPATKETVSGFVLRLGDDGVIQVKDPEPSEHPDFATARSQAKRTLLPLASSADPLLRSSL